MAYLTRGERFKDARVVYNQNGKQTMVQVSAATKVSQSTISDLENDGSARRVNYEDVACLAKHYGVSADYLLGLTDDHHINPSAVDELGLTEKAVKNIEKVKQGANNDPFFCRTLAALNSMLGGEQLQTFLGFIANAEIAAEKSRDAKEKSDAVKKSKRLLDNSDYLMYKDTYSYKKYVCVKLFEKMLDAFCKAEDLDE